MSAKKLLITSLFLNSALLMLLVFLVIGDRTVYSEEAGGNKGSDNIIKAEETTEKNNIPYYYSDIMENPIDQTYLSLVSDKRYSQIEFRNFQERYYEIWEEEYHKVLVILKSKAVYEEDKEDINRFDKNVESFFDNNKDFFETAILGDYSTDPASPEKNSWGNGTRDKLLEIRGKIYRDACIEIITLLDDSDYNFPEKIDFKKAAAH